MDISEQISQAISLTVIFSAILLAPSLVVGLLLSVFQAATQIQDFTLTFIPKMLIVGLSLYYCGDWMYQEFLEYAQGMYSGLQIAEFP